MKTRIKVLLMAISLTGLYACSKSSPGDDSTPAPTPVAATSNTTVFYVDTFRVYSTDFKGANRKVVVDEDIKSNNNYISNITTIPGKGVVVYSYTTGYLDGSTIRTVTADGATKKTIKTIPSGTYIYFLKGISDGRIYYSTGTSVATAKAYVMNADGSGETQITGVPSAEAGTYIPEPQIPAQGVGVLCNDGYYMSFTTSASGTLTTPLFNEGGSFYILTNETKANVVKMAVSADGTKAALLYKTAVANVFEVRVKDNIKTNATATVVYTVTLDADESSFNTNIIWANGTKNIIFYAGKFTTPKGSISDFTKCELIDVSAKTATNWKFTGDQVTNIVVD